MKLKMYIGNILIDQIDMDCTDMETLKEKQDYIEKHVRKMYWEHYRKIEKSQLEPRFFIEVASKMNAPHFTIDPTDAYIIKLNNLDAMKAAKPSQYEKIVL